MKSFDLWKQFEILCPKHLPKDNDQQCNKKMKSKGTFCTIAMLYIYHPVHRYNSPFGCAILFPYHPLPSTEVHIFCAKRGVTNLSKMVPSVNRKEGKLMTVVYSMTWIHTIYLYWHQYQNNPGALFSKLIFGWGSIQNIYILRWHCYLLLFFKVI